MSRGQAEPVRGVEPPKDPGPDEASAPRDAELDRARVAELAAEVAELAAENARLNARYQIVAGERDVADAAVAQLAVERDRAIAEADRLHAALEAVSLHVQPGAGKPNEAWIRHRVREALDGAS